MTSRLFSSLCALALGLLLTAGSVQAQVPTNPFNYARTKGHGYDVNGNLRSATTEPTNASACIVRSVDYDTAGNVNSTTYANCTGAPASAGFQTRTSLAWFAAVPTQSITVNGVAKTVAINAGIFETSSQDALGYSQSRQYDPRFGAVIQTTDINGLVASTTVDDFGRTVKQTAVDGTSVVNYYCVLSSTGLDQSANTAGCPTPASGEAPSVAVSFVHAEARSTSNTKMGPFQRTYLDRLGRTVRTATESFDGASQPAGRSGALVVSDTVYNAFGAKLMETAPYYLASGSSDTAGANNVGVTMYVYDTLGRGVARYTADPDAGSTQTHSFGGAGTVAYGTYGVQLAALTTTSYAGQTVIVTNNLGQQRKEERAANGSTLRVTDASGAQLAYLYEAFGGLVKSVDALQNSISSSYDYAGRKVQLTDPDKGLITYGYNALGELNTQQNATQRTDGTQTTMAYDLGGRMTSRTDPEYVSTWYYDAYKGGGVCNKGRGRLCEATTSIGLDKKFVYDNVGRLINTRQDTAYGPSFATSVAFDTATGRLASRTFPTGLQVGYSYSALGYAQGMTLLTAITIQPLPSTPGGTAGAGGSLSAGSNLWLAKVVNAFGGTEQSLLANGVVNKTIREAGSTRISAVTAGIGSGTLVLNHAYAWDSVNNLVGRIDANGTDASGNLNGEVSEAFGYDNVNRLSGYQVSGPSVPALNRNVTLRYNALGMLLFKSDVGNYVYGAAGAAQPHFLRSLTGATGTTQYTPDGNGNVIAADGGKYRSIAYTSFDLPNGTSGIKGPGDSPAYRWLYDENHARVKEIRVISGAGANAGTRTLWYLHPDNVGGLGFESEDNAPTTPSASNPAVTSNRHFLSVGSTVVGVLVTNGSIPLLTASQTAPDPLSVFPNNSVRKVVKLEFWHKDHLGSLAATTDHLGAVTARYSYDPFGKRRDTTGSYDESGTVVVDWSAAVNYGTARGFTGHEGLDDIGIVHMNGRLFDPTLGLFLQADPHISDPGNLQNFNRYAYVSNNPLNATDPSGFIPYYGGAAGDSAVADTAAMLNEELGIMRSGAFALMMPTELRFSASFMSGVMSAMAFGANVGDISTATGTNPGNGTFMRSDRYGPFFVVGNADATGALEVLEKLTATLGKAFTGPGVPLSETDRVIQRYQSCESVSCKGQARSEMMQHFQQRRAAGANIQELGELSTFIAQAAIAAGDYGTASQALSQVGAASLANGLSGVSAARGLTGTAAAAKVGDKIVYRLGTDKESASRLTRKSAEAEQAGFPHGVSVTTTKPPAGTPCSSASCTALEARGLKVHHTPTRNDPNHHTVELPKPVTPESARAFNETFGRQ